MNVPAFAASVILVLRDGKWKLVADKGKPSKRYDLEADRTEGLNFGNKHPQTVKKLARKYAAWAM